MKVMINDNDDTNIKNDNNSKDNKNNFDYK